MKLNCIVTAGTTNDKTGLFSPICEQKNLVMYEGADIIAGLLAGQPLQLSHMYFHYYNSSTVVTAPELDRTMGRTWFYNNIPGTGNVNSTQDWLRVPIITTPRLFKSPSDSANYNNNGIYLTATSAAASTPKEGESSGNLPFNNTSKIIAVALVSATDPSDYRKDKIFSRVNLTAPITVASGSQPTIFWSVQIS